MAITTEYKYKQFECEIDMIDFLNKMGIKKDEIISIYYTDTSCFGSIHLIYIGAK